VELADREAWPEPSIGASWHREGGPNEHEDVIFGTLTLPIPLWQRNQGARAEARADLAIAEAELESLEGRLRARLARAESAVRAAAVRIAVFGTEVLPSFEQNLSMLERAHELGEIDVLDVSVAVERFLRAQDDALDARADYFDALADLEETVGADPHTRGE
jgi:cobalt-zinc-cadmium efflux system outer membrane protein